MPIYEYVCRLCGHREEALQGPNDQPPICTHDALNQTRKSTVAPIMMQRAVTAPSAFILKGEGWSK